MLHKRSLGCFTTLILLKLMIAILEQYYSSDEPEYRQVITIEPLTERELAVLQLIVDGHSNDAIARKLYLSVGSQTHVHNI